jgi:hypothetical protein
MKEKKVREKGESKVKGNSFGASGFTLAVLSIISIGGYFGVLFSMAGFVFCLVQQRNKPTKLGKAGLILSVIGFIGGLLAMAFLTPWLVKYMESFPAA